MALTHPREPAHRSIHFNGKVTPPSPVSHELPLLTIELLLWCDLERSFNRSSPSNKRSIPGWGIALHGAPAKNICDTNVNEGWKMRSIVSGAVLLLGLEAAAHADTMASAPVHGSNAQTVAVCYVYNLSGRPQSIVRADRQGTRWRYIARPRPTIALAAMGAGGIAAPSPTSRPTMSWPARSTYRPRAVPAPCSRSAIPPTPP